ncbi:MAG: type 1 periplasmic binding fold superfamily protein [Saprospiraceae bacterium]|nr:type 1 periplasmic binding fold superfamily protein [Saprospiraceae bacterium]MCB9326254.1 type 1 periplasmic binding fold superfamily protein [Lewinellaceae bacterium]
MQTNYKYILMAGIVASALFSACEKKDPVIPNEEEIITTLTYTLTPVNAGDVVVLTFKDLDGDGGNDPVITGGTLSSNTVYTGTLSLLNETESPAGDVGAEIKGEDEAHQFFFQALGGLDVGVDYTDTDSEGHPVGLETTVTTGNASLGQLSVILRHQPDKSAAGVADGDITNAGGETDIEVIFDVEISN